MKTKLIILLLALFSSTGGQAFACSVCYGQTPTKTTENMAIAIWFLMAAVMSVLGGVGAFSFHLWRHARMPLEPHHELTEEDLEKYD